MNYPVIYLLYEMQGPNRNSVSYSMHVYTPVVLCRACNTLLHEQGVEPCTANNMSHGQGGTERGSYYQ